MKLIDAYNRALDDENDPTERQEFSDSAELKTIVIEEITEAMKEIRDNKTNETTIVGMVKPLFSCVSFFFLIGIRVGKILRDAEILENEEHSAE